MNNFEKPTAYENLDSGQQTDRSVPSSECSEDKHKCMYRDGWKYCWHCGTQLVPSFDLPNKSITETDRKGDT